MITRYCFSHFVTPKAARVCSFRVSRQRLSCMHGRRRRRRRRTPTPGPLATCGMHALHSFMQVLVAYSMPWWRAKQLSGLAIGNLKTIELVADSTNPSPGSAAGIWAAAERSMASMRSAACRATGCWLHSPPNLPLFPAPLSPAVHCRPRPGSSQPQFGGRAGHFHHWPARHALGPGISRVPQAGSAG